MARTTATNFTGPLQFPYATAGTDIFQKGDIQTLALAVDQHTHAPGLGLPVAAAGIAAGSITSAMIADGTIQAVDLAPNAAVIQHQASGATATPSTTSATPVDIPDMLISFTSPVAGQLLASLTATVIVTGSVSNTLAVFNLALDGSATNLFTIGNPTVYQIVTIHWVFALSAGAHILHGQWSILNAGTLYTDSTRRVLTGLELH